MATHILLFLNCPAKSILSRCFQSSKRSCRRCQYSLSKVLYREEKPPVKWSTSSAAKVSIAENIGLKEHKEQKFKKVVVVFSVFIFLLYFCVIREENDMDKIISGEMKEKSDELELIDLKLKLYYCEKNNLPKANIEAKIQEILDRNRKPVFTK